MTYPFMYLGHGEGYARKALECYLWFDEAVPPERQSVITEAVPEPLSSFFHWHDDVLHFGSDDALEAYIHMAYGEVPVDDTWDFVLSEDEWSAFRRDLDRWLADVHGKEPIFLFVSTINVTGPSEWHQWSIGHVPRLLARLTEAFHHTGDAREGAEGRASILAWVLFFALDYLERSPEALPADTLQKVVRAIDASVGSDRYIDGKNVRVLGNLMLEGASADDQAKTLSSLRRQTQGTLLLTHFEAVLTLLGEDGVTELFSDFMALPLAIDRDFSRLLGAMFGRDDEELLTLFERLVSIIAGNADVMGQLDGSPSAALFRLGCKHSHRKNFHTATRYYQAALQLPKPSLEVYNNLLQAYFMIPSWDNALNLAEYVQSIAADNPSIYHNTAYIYAKRDMPEKAIEQAALAKKHGYQKMAKLRTDIAPFVGNDVRFREFFLVSRDPTKAWTAILEGSRRAIADRGVESVLEVLGEWVESFDPTKHNELFEEVIALFRENEDHIEVIEGLVKLLTENEDTRASLGKKGWNQLPEFVYNLGVARQERGQQQRAARLYEVGLGMPNTHLYTYNNLISAYCARGDYSRAVSTFDRLPWLVVAYVGKSNPILFHTMANVHCLRGDTQAALEFVERAKAEGYGGMASMASDDELAPLHDDPKFKELVSAED